MKMIEKLKMHGAGIRTGEYQVIGTLIKMNWNIKNATSWN